MTVDQWLSLGLVLLWACFWLIVMIENCVTLCKGFSVVRCEDCVHKDYANTVSEKGCLICPVTGLEITVHDYCIYGERRDDCE